MNEDWMTRNSLTRHPILRGIHDACQAVEACGASVALTHAVTTVGDLMEPARVLLDERDADRAEVAAARQQVAAYAAARDEAQRRLSAFNAYLSDAPTAKTQCPWCRSENATAALATAQAERDALRAERDTLAEQVSTGEAVLLAYDMTPQGLRGMADKLASEINNDPDCWEMDVVGALRTVAVAFTAYEGWISSAKLQRDQTQATIASLREQLASTTATAVRVVSSSMCDRHAVEAKQQSFDEFSAAEQGCSRCLREQLAAAQRHMADLTEELYGAQNNPSYDGPSRVVATKRGPCTCWLGTDATFGSSEARMRCAVHGDPPHNVFTQEAQR